ncbi:hypothetical protein DFH06DRAFT_1327674 [Mycena polygramma]|nr:hypothetical protein DFH06DRAFT_1327674 [Mycena polygramma]
MPHPQSTSLSAHSTVPPFASHSIATGWQLSVGEGWPGMEKESATEYEYATADDGSEWHVTAAAVYDGIDWPNWDVETQAFFATQTGYVQAQLHGFIPADAFSLQLIFRVYPDLYSPPVFPARYERFMATELESFTIPPLEPASSLALPADTMHAEAEEAAYEPESYDAGMDQCAPQSGGMIYHVWAKSHLP